MKNHRPPAGTIVRGRNKRQIDSEWYDDCLGGVVEKGDRQMEGAVRDNIPDHDECILECVNFRSKVGYFVSQFGVIGV